MATAMGRNLYRTGAPTFVHLALDYKITQITKLQSSTETTGM